jgi:hypothetical protein
MRRISILLVCLAVMAGCNPSQGAKGTLSGNVTYKGHAVNGGSLNLISVSSPGIELPIALGQDGSFRSADVPAGDYKVVIEPSAGVKGPPNQGLPPEMKERLEKANMSQPPTIPIPEKYKKGETTDLTLTVKSGGETKVNLELKD